MVEEDKVTTLLVIGERFGIVGLSEAASSAIENKPQVIARLEEQLRGLELAQSGETDTADVHLSLQIEKLREILKPRDVPMTDGNSARRIHQTQGLQTTAETVSSQDLLVGRVLRVLERIDNTDPLNGDGKKRRVVPEPVRQNLRVAKRLRLRSLAQARRIRRNHKALQTGSNTPTPQLPPTEEQT
eukprot:c3931_g1_i2.p1 GENE.c3931_g1_i2~~c3931_g1_i2.p1  ORF type:complete len:186 (+),score=40.16 c3931_g1_i2:395-952(+)